jgi:hypothetical protein
MAILWQDDKINPEIIIKLFEREQKAWLEMAEAIEQMKASMVTGGAVNSASAHVLECRARAESLKRLVVRLCEQFGFE